MEPQRGSGWLGVPAMLAVAVFVAVAKTVTGFVGLIEAAVGILVVLLAIGLAMTIAKRS